uniref:Uncharacterized protein n=1 Tax=Arundo donax TaxID=35708 RepID=A0A0A9EST2_ARUDO
MTEGPGKGVWTVIGLQAGTAIEETGAAAMTGTGIMTAEEAMIATMTGKETEKGDLVAMIRGATADHVPQGTVLGIMIDTGVMTVEISTRNKLEMGTRCNVFSLEAEGFSMHCSIIGVPVREFSRWGTRVTTAL